jgi:hypothetical protein
MMRQQTHQAASKQAPHDYAHEEVPSFTQAAGPLKVVARSNISISSSSSNSIGGVRSVAGKPAAVAAVMSSGDHSWGSAATSVANNNTSSAAAVWASRPHGPPTWDFAIAGSTWPPPDPRQLARRRAIPGSSFPPVQAAALCQAKGLSGGSNDMNKKVIDAVKVAAENADGTTLMCLVYTIAKNHLSAAACRDTWASRCDGFVVMSNEADESLPSARVTHEGPEEYNNIWQKVRSIWKYVSLAYAADFEWFFIGGDDLFVIPSNLRAYLHSPAMLEASQHGLTPIFLGRRFQIPNGQFFNSGGAGYGLNRAALKLLVEHLDGPKVRTLFKTRGAARKHQIYLRHYHLLVPWCLNRWPWACFLLVPAVPAAPNGLCRGRERGSLLGRARRHPARHPGL